MFQFLSPFLPRGAAQRGSETPSPPEPSVRPNICPAAMHHAASCTSSGSGRSFAHFLVHLSLRFSRKEMCFHFLELPEARPGRRCAHRLRIFSRYSERPRNNLFSVHLAVLEVVAHWPRPSVRTNIFFTNSIVPPRCVGVDACARLA